MSTSSAALSQAVSQLGRRHMRTPLKIGRKIRIFGLGRKNNNPNKKKMVYINDTFTSFSALNFTLAKCQKHRSVCPFYTVMLSTELFSSCAGPGWAPGWTYLKVHRLFPFDEFCTSDHIINDLITTQCTRQSANFSVFYWFLGIRDKATGQELLQAWKKKPEW